VQTTAKIGELRFWRATPRLPDQTAAQAKIERETPDELPARFYD